MPGGRPKKKYSQALRILKIWQMLHSRSRLTITELTHEFSINARTVHRDLAVLQEGYAIEEAEKVEGGEKTFRLAATGRVDSVKFTQFEMIALYMGKNMFAFTEGTDLASAMNEVWDKLQQRLEGKNVALKGRLPAKLYCTAGFPKSFQGADDTLNNVVSGLINEYKVAMTYRIPGRPPYEDVLHPYTLIAHNHALYVYGFSEHAQARRMFALERIKGSLRRSKEPFTYPEPYDPARELANAFGITAGARAETVRLLFSPTVADYVEARTWHKSQSIKRRGDGRLEMEITITVGEELLHWLTGYGAGVQVLAPRSLRNDVLARHRAALGPARRAAAR